MPSFFKGVEGSQSSVPLRNERAISWKVSYRMIGGMLCLRLAGFSKNKASVYGIERLVCMAMTVGLPMPAR